MAPKVITSVDVKSSAIITAVILFFVGIFELILYWLISNLPEQQILAFDNPLWIPTIIIGAVICAIFGFVFGCIWAWAYNLAAKHFGGQKLDIEDE
nr:hypothetical protein [uncultured Methanocorpusculum sp.]